MSLPAKRPDRIGAVGNNGGQARSSVSAAEADRLSAVHGVAGDANRPSAGRDGQLEIEGGRVVAHRAKLPVQVIKFPGGQFPAVSEGVSIKENICAVTPTSIAGGAALSSVNSVVAVDDTVAHDLDVKSRREMRRAQLMKPIASRVGIDECQEYAIAIRSRPIKRLIGKMQAVPLNRGNAGVEV